jgi:hypothetical protein
MSARRAAGSGMPRNGARIAQERPEPRKGTPGPPGASAPFSGRSRAKYGNVKKTVDGITFDSLKEAARYGVLRLRERAGEIAQLEVHPRFPLVVHGQSCGDYIGDFAYRDADGVAHVEDVKSAATRKLPVYRLKSRLVWALYGLRVEEV